MVYRESEYEKIGESLIFFSYVTMVFLLFSRGHATLHLVVLVGPSVGHISKLRSVFALLLLPNRPRLDCRVSGLVFLEVAGKKNVFQYFISAALYSK